jgi:GH25 family lysozyme M1 (1,4-beta-N-acetylmuramidase)
MKENQEYIEKKKPRKRKKNDNLAIIVILFMIILLAIGACIVLLFHYEEEKNAAIDAMNQMEALEESNKNLLTQAQAEKLVEDGKQEMLDQMQSMMEDGQGILSLLQYFYPDDVVVSGNGRYYFFPILDTLEHNDFDLDNFTYQEKNEDSGELEGETSYKIDENTYAARGIDVSSFQGDIEWEKVKDDGIEFAFIRLGFRGYESGKIVLDTKYEYNIEESLSAGIDTGVYFFTEALTEKEAIEEADFVIENLSGYKINLPVVLDVEESASVENSRTKDMTSEQRTQNVIAFCNRIKDAGYDVMIYGNLKSFMLMMDYEQLENYDKWLAYYRYPFHFPYKVRMWQYSASQKVEGIKSNTDMNLMFY